MLASVLAATLHGIEGRVIRVEVDVAPGSPGFTIVGVPEASLREARERSEAGSATAGLSFRHDGARPRATIMPATLAYRSPRY